MTIDARGEPVVRTRLGSWKDSASSSLQLFSGLFVPGSLFQKGDGTGKLDWMGHLGGRRRAILAIWLVGFGLAVTSAASAATTGDPPAAALTAGDPVIAAAGDIACDPAASGFHGGNGTANGCSALKTSNLLVGAPLAGVLPLGDNQYECGGLRAFQTSYALSWGRVDPAIVHPVAGNHEYDTKSQDPKGTDCSPTANAAGYFAYFGASAGDPSKGYYSYDVGSWHLIALNANCKFVPCKAGSAQELWLKNDLLTHPSACTLAYWHQPRFSSGGNGGTSSVAAFWNDLYASHAEVVLNGHLHAYERFAPLNPSGALDSTNGIREFVVGTGGDNHGKFGSIRSGSQVRNNTTFGVLELTLGSTSYSWSFVPAGSGTFTDSGNEACH